MKNLFESRRGFIRGDDGGVVYFHRHAVLEDGWEALEVGTRVEYRMEEGDLGPQAASLRITATGAARSPTPVAP